MIKSRKGKAGKAGQFARVRDNLVAKGVNFRDDAADREATVSRLGGSVSDSYTIRLFSASATDFGSGEGARGEEAHMVIFRSARKTA